MVYGKIKLDAISLEDCREYLKKIENKFLPLIVIDPPYNQLPKEWDNFKDWHFIRDEFHRVLKDNGQLYIFGKQPMLMDIANIFYDKFEFRFELIWNKGKGLWASNYMPMRSHELIWCFKKRCARTQDLYFDLESIKTPGKPYVRKNKAVSTIRNSWKPNHTIYKDGRRFPLSVINCSAVIRKGKNGGIKHPTEKPIGILEWVIKSSSKENDIVLDCFMGSGTTAVACKRLGRHFIGCELNRDYYNAAIKRIDLEKITGGEDGKI